MDDEDWEKRYEVWEWALEHSQSDITRPSEDWTQDIYDLYYDVFVNPEEQLPDYAEWHDAFYELLVNVLEVYTPAEFADLYGE